MSARRVWTLPNGTRLLLDPSGNAKEANYSMLAFSPTADAPWVPLAYSMRDAEALAAVLAIEIKPNLGGGRS